jgi:hypothetical protein
MLSGNAMCAHKFSAERMSLNARAHKPNHTHTTRTHTRTLANTRTRALRAVCADLHKFSKASVLVNFLYFVAIESTF